jgi:thiamine transport system permease protein
LTLQKRSWLLWFIPLIFLGLFFLYPLTAIFNLALRSTGQGWASFPWQRVGSILGFTIFQAALSTFLTILVGLPAAFLFGRYDFKGKKILRILSTLPFILPTVVVAAGFNAIIGPNGMLNTLLMQIWHLSQPPIQILNTLVAILLAHVFYNTAVVIRTVGSSLEQLDPRLEQASRTLGASPWRSFWEVTMPLLRSSLTSAALVVFLFDFTSFGVILLMGGPQYATLEVEIYYQTMQLLNLPLAAWLSAIQLGCTLILTVLILRRGGGLPVPIAPRLSHSNNRKIKSWGEKAFLMIMMILLIILLVMPLVALVFRSFTQVEIAHPGSIRISGFTLQYYQELFINRQQSLFYVPPIEALSNSFFYALVASILALFFGSLATYALLQKSRWNQLFDPLIMLPMGTSAVTLGLGFIIVFTTLPNARDYYPILIPIAHSLVALPFVVRVLQPVLASIPSSLKQVAATLGASPWQVWFKVELPIASRAAAIAALFAFSISLGEFGATSFLSRPDIPTLPVAIFRFLSQPGSLNYGQALAMATILMVLCALVMLVIDRINIKNG